MMHRHNDAASQHLTEYGRILLRIEDSSSKTIIEKAWPRTSTQELQIGIQHLLPLKCMLKQLMQCCQRYNLLQDFQSIYRRNYSSETSLIMMVNDILWGMDKRRNTVTMVIILDLSAAFYTVDHDVLLVIL